MFITSSGVRTFSLSGGHCNNTPDTQEHIKTVAKQVWFYFIRRPIQPGYAGTITNIQIVLNTQIKLPKKNTCQNSPTHKNPKIKNFKPKKILRSSLSLEIGRTPLWPTWGPPSQRQQALSVIWHNH